MHFKVYYEKTYSMCAWQVATLLKGDRRNNLLMKIKIKQEKLSILLCVALLLLLLVKSLPVRLDVGKYLNVRVLTTMIYI